MSWERDCSIGKGIRMTKGEECLYLQTNVFIISRASKGNRIRQEIRITIIWMLTGKNVMLLNTECMWCFLEKHIVCWHTGDMLGKKRESWKAAWALQGKIKVEREHCFMYEGIHFEERQGKFKVLQQIKVIKFCLFTPERAETQGSTDQVYKSFLPTHTPSPVASWKDHQLGELCPNFIFCCLPIPLPPLAFTL